MAEPISSRNVNAKQAIELIRGPLSNSDLMEKLKISPKGFADLLTQLFAKKLICESDLARRGIRFKVLKKDESTPQKPKPRAIEPQITAPQPLAAVEHPEDFLDTVELTELLSSFGQSTCEGSEGPEVDSEEPASDEELADKKGRFSISGLFKKKR